MNPAETDEREDLDADLEPDDEDDEIADDEPEETEPGGQAKPCDECGAAEGHKVGCSRLEALANALRPFQDALGGPEAELETRDVPERNEGESEAEYIARRRIEVDGREAVLSGRTGGIADQAQALIDERESATDESCLQRIAQAKEAEARFHAIANKAVKAFKEAKARTDAAVTFAAEYFARSRQVEMDFSVARQGGEPE